MSKILVGFLFFIVSISVLAHTLQNQDGINVSHYHFSHCQNGCPNDSIIENAMGFNRSDRVDAGTWEYNCHGRTFDNSNSWVNHSDAWIFGYGNQSVYPPVPGDVVVWYSGNGSINTTITKHTATIIGSWNGVNTLISSK